MLIDAVYMIIIRTRTRIHSRTYIHSDTSSVAVIRNEKPPIIPKLMGRLDTSYFRKYADDSAPSIAAASIAEVDEFRK